MILARGLVLDLVAIFCWGTALVPLKLEGSRANGVAVSTIAISTGYLVAASVAAVVVIASGGEAWANSGIVGGVVWGTGKVLNILAVAGAAGLAGGQAVQCVVNIATAFAVGVLLRGEPCSAYDAAGVVALIAGLLTIVAPCPRSDDTVAEALLDERVAPPLPGEHATHHYYHTVQDLRDDGGAASEAPRAKHGRSGFLASIALAAVAGVCFGFQTVPLLLDRSHPSAWAYSIAQAVSQFCVVCLACAIPASRAHRHACDAARAASAPAPPLVPRPLALALAAGGGVLLFAAAASINCAVSLLGVSVAQPLANTNMLVAGSWGMAFFGEMPRSLERVRFFLGCAVAIGGAVVLAVL